MVVPAVRPPSDMYNLAAKTTFDKREQGKGQGYRICWSSLHRSFERV